MARLAERGGFDVVAVYHDLLFQPAIYPLLLMAQATERVRLGPAALNPFTLHPVEIAGQIAALDAVSGGRAYLGLVRGSWLDTLGIEPRRPLTALREAVEVIRRLLAGDASGFAGERFVLAPGALAGRDPMLEVAASLAEEVRRLVEAGEREAAGRLIPDELLDRLAFAGTPEQVARQAAELYEAGADRIEFGTPHGLTPRRGVELLAARVLPELDL